MRKTYATVGYHSYTIENFSTFYKAVRKGIYINFPTVFVTPTLTQVQFDLLVTNYEAARTAYSGGGIAFKGAYLAALSALMTGLDTLGVYVTGIAANDPNIILDSGFVPNKVPSKGSAPEVSNPPVLTRGVSGEIFAEGNTIANADTYNCIVTKGYPLPEGVGINSAGQFVINGDDAQLPPGQPHQAIFDFSKSRKKHFLGLTSLTRYYFYFFTSNAYGVSQLSNPGVIDVV